MADVTDASSDPAGMGDTDQVDAKKSYTASNDMAKYARKLWMDTDDESLFAYSMNFKKRGLFVLINNKNFEPRTGMNSRSGTDADAANLYQRFKELEFEIHMFNNQTVKQMLDIMLEASRYDHANSDCFACAILSHGDEGIVYGTDATIKVDQLIEPLKGDRCPSLIGKPKVFIIQACRGSELDHGVEVADAVEGPAVDKKIYRIPTEADILYCYSTVPGYFSWRNSTKGSWFVQALCKMLQEHGKTRDFVWLMTRVSYMVAYEFESNASKEFMNKKKQVPQLVSMLTKDLYFKSKGTPV